MPRYMLDTDISSYLMKRSHPPLLSKIARLNVEAVCISVITRAELEYGVAISPRRQQDEKALGEFLRFAQALDFPQEAATHYAEIRATLKARGAMIGANDLLIAAHARALTLTLVTNNIREFSRVPHLKVENWIEQGA